MLEGPRALRADEFDALMDLVDDTFRGPDWPRPTKPKLYSLLLDPRTNLEGMRVFVADGRPVSHFGLYIRDVFCGGVTLRLASVGSVCTHPEFREQGLATRLVEDALCLCEKQGVHLMLISGGRGLYRRQGSTDVGEMFETVLMPGDVQSASQVRVESCSDELLPTCATIYQREAFRFYRPLDDWKRVVHGGSDMNREVEIFLIYEQDALRAYAVVYAPRDGESGFLEYAGSRTALWASIPKFIERHSLKRFVLSVPKHDLEWQSICHGRPHTQASIAEHTARLINLPALASALRPSLIEGLGREAEAIEWQTKAPYQITSLDGVLTIPDMPALTQLIFGPHTSAILQMLDEAGKLGIRLRDVFPVPFGHPGLNFV